MPRKAHIVKREIVPDPLYQSTLISKFANCMMYGGKKSTAQGIIYGALSIIEKKTSDDPVKLFKKAVENVKPVLRAGPYSASAGFSRTRARGVKSPWKRSWRAN